MNRPLDPRVGGWSFDPWPEDVHAFRVGEVAALLRLRADIAGGYVTEDPALIRRLYYVRPGPTSENCMNNTDAYRICRSQLTRRNTVNSGTATDSSHVICRQVCTSISLTDSAAPLANHIAHILRMRAEEQMRLTAGRVLQVLTTGNRTLRMAAGRVIAAVADFFTGRDGAMRQFPGKAVGVSCAHGAATVIHRLAVASSVAEGSPGPTRIGAAGAIHLCPKPLLKGSRRFARTMSLNKTGRLALDTALCAVGDRSQWRRLAAAALAQLGGIRYTDHVTASLLGGSQSPAVPTARGHFMPNYTSFQFDLQPRRRFWRLCYWQGYLTERCDEH